MKKLKVVLSSIVLVILAPILFVSLVILINSYTNPDEVPSFFGWKPFIVLSGSMETEIYSGDVAVVKEVDLKEINKNDIIAFKEDDIVITHRVIDIINENGTIKYKTKGDNNNVEDGGYVLAEQVEGKYQFKVRRLGNFAMFAQTPIGMIVCLSIPVGLLLLIQMIDTRGNKKSQKEAQRKLKRKIELLEKQNEELKKEGGKKWKDELI